MAITATLTSSTAYSLKYHVQYDGVGGAGSGTIHVPRATLLADSEASAGPLAALLAATDDPTDWANLPLGAELSIYPATNRTDAAGSFGARFDNSLGPPAVSNLSVYCTDGVVLEGIVEIRFNHSIDR